MGKDGLLTRKAWRRGEEPLMTHESSAVPWRRTTSHWAVTSPSSARRRNGNVVGHRIINSESGINCMDHDCVLANTERSQHEPITIRYVRAVRSRRKPQKVSFWQGDVKTVGRLRPIVTEVTH